MTREELKQIQDAFLRYRTYQQNDVAKVREVYITISFDEWIHETSVSWTRRTSTTKELDEALRDYHRQGRSLAAYKRLRDAFDKWVFAHPVWWQSDRNKKSDRYPSGIISELYQQIQVAGAQRDIELAQDGKWDAIQALRKAEKEALRTLFQGRRLVYKSAAWKGNIAAAVNQFALPAHRIESSIRQAQTTQGGSAGAIHELLGRQNPSDLAPRAFPVSTRDVKGAVYDILGNQDPHELFKELGLTLDFFAGCLKTAFNLVTGPVALLVKAVNLGKNIRDRLRAADRRYLFSPGAADAALSGIISLIDREIRVAAMDTGTSVMEIVGAACTGPAAIFTNALAEGIKVMVSLPLIEHMMKEMREGNRLLEHLQTNSSYNVELFNKSPMLGCYFVVMADTAVWLNYDVKYWGADGFMDEQARMYERAEPVREKARGFIRTSKYALSGTEYLGWEPTFANNKMEFLGMLFGSRPDKLTGTDWLLGLNKKKEPEISGPIPGSVSVGSGLGRPRSNAVVMPKSVTAPAPAPPGMMNTPLGTFPTPVPKGMMNTPLGTFKRA